MTYKLFFELIQVAICHRDSLSRMPSTAEWSMLYGLAVKQTVSGVCFCGVQRLPKEQLVEMPVRLKLQWFALATQIKARNELMNRRCVEVQRMLTEEGMKSCILKGQGVAKLYKIRNEELGVRNGVNLGLYRQSGDIDVWLWKEGLSLKENRKEVIRFARTIQPNATGAEHHVSVGWMGTEVELHYEPAYFCNPFANRRFRKWCMDYDKSKFQFSDNGFCVPDAEFNRVFLLAHAFRHYLSEGLGLRQVMDYYFLTKSLNLNNDRVIEELGMARFEKAMKWVLGYVFEGKDGEDSRKYGKMLLEHIMDGGNFGKHKANTVASRHTHFGRFINQLTHDIRLLRYYPSEAVWAPLSMIREFFRIRI